MAANLAGHARPRSPPSPPCDARPIGRAGRADTPTSPGTELADDHTRPRTAPCTPSAPMNNAISRLPLLVDENRVDHSREQAATATQASLAVESVLRSSAHVERLMGCAAHISLCERIDYEVVVPCTAPTSAILRCLSELTAQRRAWHRVHVLLTADAAAEQRTIVQDYVALHSDMELHQGAVGEGTMLLFNRLLSRATHDVVWLHPEAEFAADLWHRLRRCQTLSPNLAAIAPLCNRGAVLPLELPPSQAGRHHAQEVAEFVAQCASQLYPRVPATHDACILFVRDSWRRVGLFNLELEPSLSFIEWCQRAWLRGYECAICDDAYVQVNGGRETDANREATLLGRFPDYHDVLRDLRWLDPLRIQRLRLSERLHRRTKAQKVLLVEPERAESMQDEAALPGLADFLGREFSLTRLQTGGYEEQLRSTVNADELGLILRMPTDLFKVRHTLSGAPVDVRSPRVEQWFSDVMHSVGPELVHFCGLRHLGSFLLPAIARSAGARVVISLQDLFALCPNGEMSYANGHPCRHTSSATCGEADHCLGGKQWRAPDALPLPLSPYLEQRLRWARVALDAAHLILVPSQSAHRALCAAFGDDIEPRLQVLPPGAHGTPSALRRAPRIESGGPLRIACAGPVSPTSGFDLWQKACATIDAQQAEWLVLDSAPTRGRPPENMRFSGRCQRAQWVDLLRDVDALVLPSRAPAVDAAAVEEAFQLGIPVIAAEHGAYAERVLHGETGLLFEPGCADALAHQLRAFVTQRALREHMRTQVCALPIHTHRHALAVLRRLYHRAGLVDHDRTSSTLDLMNSFRRRHHRAGAA